MKILPPENSGQVLKILPPENSGQVLKILGSTFYHSPPPPTPPKNSGHPPLSLPEKSTLLLKS